MRVVRAKMIWKLLGNRRSKYAASGFVELIAQKRFDASRKRKHFMVKVKGQIALPG